MLALAVATAPPDIAGRIERWQPLIDTTSRRFGVPADWIARVMAAESGGAAALGRRPTRSRVGAIGLMQLMPGTWADMRTAYGLGADPDDPADNIVAGTAYLRLLYDRFGYPGLFAAYNAGPVRYGDYLAGRASLPNETRDYLVKLSNAAPFAPVSSSAPLTVFVLRHDRSGVDSSSTRSQSVSIFAIPEASR